MLKPMGAVVGGLGARPAKEPGDLTSLAARGIFGQGVLHLHHPV